jgi:hypothetical protein
MTKKPEIDATPQKRGVRADKREIVYREDARLK